jgi:hypothetical protein
MGRLRLQLHGDGILELPWSTVRGRSAIRANIEADLARFAATVHYSSNHEIEIAGDTARSRSSLLAIHVLNSSDPARHDYRKTTDGWKFTRVRVNVV